jgi:hypothetical protein
MPAKPAKKIMVQGTGPSRLNRDPRASNDPYAVLAGLHVNGKPVEDLPYAQVGKLRYYDTDEAIEKRNVGKTGHGIKIASGGRARVTATDPAKAIEERRDFRSEQSVEIFDAPDPMREIADAHVGPGMSPKFLSPARVARSGTRGFEIVNDKHGDPVKLGEMVLAQMPVERVKARNRTFQRKGQARVQEIRERFEEGQQRINRDARAGRPSALAEDEIPGFGDGLHSDGED